MSPFVAGYRAALRGLPDPGRLDLAALPSSAHPTWSADWVGWWLGVCACIADHRGAATTPGGA